jgi:very-long-chain enoyl-CoA reductase
MVKISVSTKGKPTINLDFSEKHPDKVTVAEVKSAITAKFPKVSDVGCPHLCRIGD